MSAVAEYDNAKEMLVVLQEGMLMEVLSYKMDIEEPDAASIISQALNKGQDAALRTTELTAVAVLKGEIIAQKSSIGLTAEVAYATVKERVRKELDTYVDEPEFIDLFNFLISVGVGKNTYIDGFLDFGSRFVDAKLRQLRLSAFSEAGKVDDRCPRTKIALLKRAYRKKPTNGYCPSPESRWGKYPYKLMELLEEVLQFFHVDCKEAWEQQFDVKRQGVFLANVDVAATEAFAQLPVISVTEAIKDKTKQLLLEGLQKYASQLGDALPKQTAVAEKAWIDFGCLLVQTSHNESAKPTATGEPVKARVIEFDEKSGAQLCRQKEFELEKKTTEKPDPITLPFRSWRRSPMCIEMGRGEGECSAAVSVLSALHNFYAVEDEPIDIMIEGTKIYVVASQDIESDKILLPPCVPKQSKLHKIAEHPHRAVITIQTRCSPYKIVEANASANVDAKETSTESPTMVASAAVAESDAATTVPESDSSEQQVATQTEEKGKVGMANAEGLRTRWYAVPEFKGPADVRTPSDLELGVPPRWQWSENVTMHPFWAVRRLTASQLAKEQLALPVGKAKPHFNCELTEKTITDVSLCALHGARMNTTRIVTIQCLTNTQPLRKGEELLLEIQEQQLKDAPRKRTWKDIQKNKKKRI